MLERVTRYDIKGRKYIDSPFKYYFEDLGLRNARLGFRQVEPTHMMENMLYNELRAIGMKVDVGQVFTEVKSRMDPVSARRWKSISSATVAMSEYTSNRPMRWK